MDPLAGRIIASVTWNLYPFMGTALVSDNSIAMITILKSAALAFRTQIFTALR